jgi:protein HIRA/HIR1
LAKYGYGRKNTQLPETPTQLALEEENAIINKASASKRLTGLMSGNTSITETASSPVTTAIQNTTSTDIIMTEAAEGPILNSSSSAATSSRSVVLEQKVSIAKNGKRRIQPVMLSPSASTETSTKALPSSNTTTKTTTAAAAAPMTTTTTTSSSNLLQQRPRISNMEYDDPIIPSSGIGSLVTGNKRKASDAIGTEEDEITRGNKPVTMERLKPEWIESAIPPPILQKSQVKLGLPKIKSILTAKTRPDDPTIVMECHNAPNSHNPNSLVKTKVVTSKQGIPIWVDYLPSAVLLMTGNQLLSAVSCEDGTLHVYSPSGRRYLPPILLESTAVLLQCSAQWLLCLTATGLLYTWDMMHFKSSLHGVSIAPILQIAELSEDNSHKAPSIKDVRIQKNGLPIVITSRQQAFVYHVDMKVWLRISDAWYIISEFWGSGLTAANSAASNPSTTTDNPLGWLSSRMTINNNVDATTKLILDLATADETTTAVITISHIEVKPGVGFRGWINF